MQWLCYWEGTQGFHTMQDDGTILHKRITVFLQKRCEDGIVHPTKTDTAVSHSTLGYGKKTAQAQGKWRNS